VVQADPGECANFCFSELPNEPRRESSFVGHTTFQNVHTFTPIFATSFFAISCYMDAVERIFTGFLSTRSDSLVTNIKLLVYPAAVERETAVAVPAIPGSICATDVFQ